MFQLALVLALTSSAKPVNYGYNSYDQVAPVVVTTTPCNETPVYATAAPVVATPAYNTADPVISTPCDTP
ncbi:hypothetical protein HDV02_003934, partial [Globomyces sp. JEL0801]